MGRSLLELPGNVLGLAGSSRESSGIAQELPGIPGKCLGMLGSLKMKLDTVGGGVDLGTIAKVDIVGGVDNFSKNGAE